TTGAKRTMIFPVTLSQPAYASTVTVRYSFDVLPFDGDTSEPANAVVGLKCNPGVDVVAPSGVITFKPPTSNVAPYTPTTKAINVKVCPDARQDFEQRFVVRLDSVTGTDFNTTWVLGNAIGYGTIFDDDPDNGLTANIGDSSAWEGNI